MEYWHFIFRFRCHTYVDFPRDSDASFLRHPFLSHSVPVSESHALSGKNHARNVSSLEKKTSVNKGSDRSSQFVRINFEIANDTPALAHIGRWLNSHDTQREGRNF